MKAKLGRRYIDGLKPAASDYDVFDATVPGFAVRVRTSGAKSFVLRYRPKGAGRSANPRTLTLGKHPALTPEDARTLAQRALADIAAGRDPARERAAVDRRTVAGILAAYLAHLDGRASWRIAESDIRLHLGPAIGARRVAELDRADVERLKKALEKEGKRRRAAACVTLLRAALRHAKLDTTAAEIRVSTWRKRQRAASHDELRRVLAACRDALAEGEIWPWAIHLLLLLILTGARPAEIRTARWSDVDLPGAQLTRKEHKTAEKGGGPRVIDLAPEACRLIASIPRIAGNPYLIPGKVRGKPLRDYSRAWRAIQERAGVKGLWVYDLRRTWASMALGAGVSKEQIARALGHSDLAATDGYSWLLPDDRASIAGRVAARVARLSAPPDKPQEPTADT